MSIEAICTHDKLEETVVNLLDPRRKPTKVQIVAPIITDFKIRGSTFLKKIEYLLSSCSEFISIVVVTRKPILRTNMGAINKAQVKQRMELIEKLETELSAIGNVKVHKTKNKLHAKLILVENRKEKLFLIGSSNYTR
ncbi:MAG: hypothetical protein AABX40_00160, partial [Candidatus Hydrothermarchaeota archaeon]